MLISVIVPFYYGNKYLPRLFKSISKTASVVDTIAEFEIVIVNDSPDDNVIIKNIPTNILVNVFNNAKNLGIQQARINGLKAAKGDWIVFLDQDDLMVSAGYSKQIELTNSADVIVGNGIYEYPNGDKQIYKNQATMNYFIKEKRFLQIRNLIPSPGECLVKKSVIPDTWSKQPLVNSGADDWYLWILLFKAGVKFAENSSNVYIHKYTGGENLSFDLDKMHTSSQEMLEILSKNKILDKQELKELEHAIEFKYLQDTKKLNGEYLYKYRDSLLRNIIYHIRKNL